LLRRSKNKRTGSAEEPEPSHAGVLVACHDADTRELISRVVGRAGHAVEQTDGVAATLAALAQPRLAVVTLLRNQSSTELLTEIRAAEDPQVAAVPVLAIGDDHPTANAAKVAGADGMATRPFHADELIQELDAVLARTPEDRAELREAAALRRLE
jgi:DNA-binding response OmpR family regulator